MTMLLSPGPVVAVADGVLERWLFLCRPDRWPAARVVAELADAGVWVCPARTEIMLPRIPAQAQADECRWVEPPSGVGVLPDQSSVVYAARRVIAEQAARGWAAAR
jgi:hypothetical protein